MCACMNYHVKLFLVDASHLRHQTSHLRHQTSHLRHQTSHPMHQTSHPRHQISHPRHQISHPRHQTSHLRHRTFRDSTCTKYNAFISLDCALNCSEGFHSTKYSFLVAVPRPAVQEGSSVLVSRCSTSTCCSRRILTRARTSTPSRWSCTRSLTDRNCCRSCAVVTITRCRGRSMSARSAASFRRWCSSR